jgi:hypothetical protein
LHQNTSKNSEASAHLVTHPEDLVMKAQQVKHQELVEETCELMA